MTNKHKLVIIYNEAQTSRAMTIAEHLCSAVGMTRSETANGLITLTAEKALPQEAAIVVLSDEATEDKTWQKNVRSLGENIRLIPVGFTENADFSDPAVIPKTVADINIIKETESFLGDVTEAVILDTDFYKFRNSLQSSMQMWKMTNKSEAFLMRGTFRILKAKHLIKRRRNAEKDPRIVKELDEINEYLSVSLTEYLPLATKHFIKGAGYIFITILAVLLTVTLVKLGKFIAGTNRRSVTVAVSTSDDYPHVQALKALDAYADPGISNETERSQYLDTIVTYMDHSWPNTPLGFKNKYMIRTSDVCCDERYTLTACNEGHLIKWDNYTGRAVKDIKVSKENLTAAEEYGDAEFYAVSDNSGKLYISEDMKNWTTCPDVMEFDHTSLQMISFSEDRSSIVVYDGSSVWLYREDGNSYSMTGKYTGGIVCCAEPYKDGALAIISRNCRLSAVTITKDGATETLEIPIEKMHNPPSDRGRTAAALRNGRLVIADKSGDLVLWDISSPSKAVSAGTSCTHPTSAVFVNDSTIVYCDETEGIILYDIEKKLALGSLLSICIDAFQLDVQGSTLFAMADTVMTQDFSDLLPADLNGKNITAEYSSKQAVSSGLISSASATDAHIATYTAGGKTVILDLASHVYVGPAQRHEDKLYDGLDENTAVDVTPYLRVGGEVSTLGITGGGNKLVVGTDGGWFMELWCREEDAKLFPLIRHRIPSGAAITKISGAEDYYYLTDTEGYVWQVRKGAADITSDAFCEAVKKRLHSAFSKDIYDSVRKNVADKVGFEILE